MIQPTRGDAVCGRAPPSTMATCCVDGGGGLLALSLLLWALFGLVHLAGLRADLSALSLTIPAGSTLAGALTGAAVYLLSWFGAILVSPVLVIAAAVLHGVAWLTGRGNRALTALRGM